MKKGLLFLILICSFAVSYGQFPVTQTTGSGNTLVKSRGGQGADSGFIYPAFLDTARMNGGFIKNIAGIMVRQGDTLWIRNKTATRWLALLPGASSGADSAIFQTNYRTDTMRTRINADLAARVYGVENGLYNDGNTFKLGGDLTETTELNGDEVFGFRLHKITDFELGLPSMGLNKVLTSDANGFATWQTPASVDTTSLSNRINQKVGKSDSTTYGGYYPWSNPLSFLTSASIAGKLNISDTSAMLSNYLRSVSLGLSKSGQTVSLDTASSVVLSRQRAANTYQPIGSYVTGSGTATRVAFWNGSSSLSSSSNLYWDNSNAMLGIGTSSPSQRIDVIGSGNEFTYINVANPTASPNAETGFNALSNSGSITYSAYPSNYSGATQLRGRGGLTSSMDSGVAFVSNTANTNAGFFFHTNGYNERMRIMTSGNIIVGGTSIAENASAIFNIGSTTKGFLMPRMTATQRNAIGSPATGLMVWDTDSSRHFGYNGSSWKGLAYTDQTSSGTVTSVATGLGLTGGTITTSGTVSLDTASASVISRQRAAATYANTGLNNVFTTRQNFTSIVVNKDSLPTTTTNRWVVTVDTSTGRFNRKLETNLVVYSNHIAAARDAGLALYGGNMTHNPFMVTSTASTLTDNVIHCHLLRLEGDTTISGLRFYLSTLGVFTADQTNSLSLYSIASGTATLVAETANDATLYTTGTNTWKTAAFATPVVLTRGNYYGCFLYNNSAQTTAATMGSSALSNLNVSNLFPNNNRLSFTLSGQNTAPATITLSATTANAQARALLIY